MTLGVFWHWVASALILKRSRLAADGGYWLYEKPREKCLPVQTRAELIPQVLSSIHTWRAFFKERALVAEIISDESQLDCERFAFTYLNCVRIEKDTVQNM
jgi:hypothetical protein